MALLAGLPVVASADGAEIYKGIYPVNGFLSFPLDCREPGGHVIYFFFREGDPALGEEGDYLLEGIAIRTPEQAKAFDDKPDEEFDIMSFKAEGSLASVWTVEQTADFCKGNGEFDVAGFADYFRSIEGMWLWDVAEQDIVSVKWNFTWTDTLYKDSLVATGQRLTFRSLLWIRGEDGVITDMRDVTKLIWH
jgi:hypothetical protein